MEYRSPLTALQALCKDISPSIDHCERLPGNSTSRQDPYSGAYKRPAITGAGTFCWPAMWQVNMGAVPVAFSLLRVFERHMLDFSALGPCSNAALAVQVLATAFLAAFCVLALLASLQPVLVSAHAVSAELHCRSPAGPFLSAHAFRIFPLIARLKPALDFAHAVSAELQCCMQQEAVNRCPAAHFLSACASDKVLCEPDLAQWKLQACFWMLRMPFVDWRVPHNSCRCLKPHCSRRAFCLAV